MEYLLEQIFDNFKKFSKNNAIKINEKNYTYFELSEIIGGIQAEINNKNIESTVGIIVENNIYTYAAIFAIWFNGNAFVPLNCTNPPERNTQIIDESNIKTVLISSSKSRDLLKNDIRVVSIYDFKNNSNIYLNKNYYNNLAYILYTSGSTGTPKGVSISFSNIIAFISSINGVGFGFSVKDKFLQMFDLTFDVSIACLLIPLTCGASLYTVPYGSLKFTYIFKILKEENINVITIVPSLISYLKPYIDDIKFLNVSHCILTAEASNIDDVKLLEKVIPNSSLFNFYGPTEGTVWTHYYKWEKKIENLNYNGILSIGKPLTNVMSIIVDQKNEVINTGEKGELCLSGNQITSGYYNNDKINRDAFFIKKINKKTIRFYKTGDICFLDDSKNYMYCGRKDSQVQIQGFRVELGEIEYLIRKEYEVKNTLSMTMEDKYKRNHIYLFIEDLSKNITGKNVKEFLIKTLPSYMIPKKIYVMEKFPINSSSKIDKIKIRKILQRSIFN